MLPASRPFGLCAYGVPYLCGFAGKGTPQVNLRPLDVFGLVETGGTPPAALARSAAGVRAGRR